MLVALGLFALFATFCGKGEQASSSTFDFDLKTFGEAISGRIVETEIQDSWIAKEWTFSHSAEDDM